MNADHEAQTLPTPPPTPLKSNTKILVLANLILRILIFVFLLIALIVLATDTGVLATDTVDLVPIQVSIKFYDFISYRYMMAAIIIGFLYSTVEIGFSIYQLIVGRRLFNGKPMLHFHFYADKVVSGLLATAAGAGFAVSVDFQGFNSGAVDFLAKGNATACLVLFAYLFSEASQIISFRELPKADS